jgi:dihydrofolate reductase
MVAGGAGQVSTGARERDHLSGREGRNMGKIIAFTHVSVDGYFAGPDGEIDWFKPDDEEDRGFAAEVAGSPGTLIFGRTTYEMMAKYWPTPEAMGSNPVMAGVMNSSPKIVFSRTLKPVEDGPVWRDIRVMPGIRREEILRLKDEDGGNFAILGSGSIVQQFSRLGLIDEYQLMVNPVILGAGRYLFRDVNRMNLKLLGSRTFRNGRVFLRYAPV